MHTVIEKLSADCGEATDRVSGLCLALVEIETVVKSWLTRESHPFSIQKAWVKPCSMSTLCDVTKRIHILTTPHVQEAT